MAKIIEKKKLSNNNTTTTATKSYDNNKQKRTINQKYLQKKEAQIYPGALIPSLQHPILAAPQK
jgi:hypothetical protein